MAKIFYVTENAPDYAQVNFFKTEKEALEFGNSQIPNFEMRQEPMNDEEADGEEWFYGAELTFKKGILFSYEEAEVYVQEMDEDEAREYVEEEVGENGGAIFFNGFTKGMYGYLGSAADGKGYKWDWDGADINESNKINIKHKMKHIKLFEQFINEKKNWNDPDPYNIGDEFMYEFPKNSDWEDSMWSSLEDWMREEWGPNADIQKDKGFDDCFDTVQSYLQDEGYSV